jgi:hypothetical protein
MIRVDRSRLDDAGDVIQPLGTWLQDAADCEVSVVRDVRVVPGVRADQEVR